MDRITQFGNIFGTIEFKPTEGLQPNGGLSGATLYEIDRPGLVDGIVRQAYANRQLGQAWEALSLLGTRGIQERVEPQHRIEDAGSGGALPYPQRTSDNVENRELKAEYSGANSIIENVAPDARKYQVVSDTIEDGLRTVREEGPDGSWREFSYTEDRQYVVIKDSNGREYYKDGNLLRYKNNASGAEWAFGVGDDGAVFKVQRDPEGNIKTKVAKPDGGYMELDQEGAVTKSSDPDPKMAKFEELAGRIGSSIGADGKSAPLTSEQRYLLAGALSRFDPATVRNLIDSGITIKLVDENNPPKGGYPGGRDTWVEGGQGYYTLKDKTIVLKQSDFAQGGNIIVVDTIHHELTHAIDDMLQPDTASQVNDFSEKDPRINALFKEYTKRIEDDPGAAWSRYAATNVQEYLAEGVMKYLGGDRAKAMLKEADPNLYAYVEKVLAKSTDVALPQQQRIDPIASWNPFPWFDGVHMPGWNNPFFPPMEGPFGFPQNTDPSAMWNNLSMMRAMQLQQMWACMLPMMAMFGNPFMGFGFMPSMFGYGA
jgi:hypothetical protein